MDLKLQAGSIPQVGKNVAVLGIKIPSTAHQTNHTMLVLDCSGSMSGSIEDVRRDSRAYVNGLGESDYVSVIIFSGHGRARLVGGPTQCNANGKTLLERAIASEVRILDTTVFSEPLELCIRTAKNLAGDEIVHNALLFTDGCAVPTSWPVSTEHNKSLDAARTLRYLGVLVSVIGYGVYYDAEFISHLMAAAGNEGVFRHISEIDEFGPVIEHIRATFAKTVIADIDLAFTPNKGSVGMVYKTTPQLASSAIRGQFKSLGLYEGAATLFMELDAPATAIVISGTINGVSVNQTVTAEKLSDDNAADFVRVLGAHAFLVGDHATAAQMLSVTQDEGLAEKVGSAYSQRETREVGDMLRRVFVDRRFIGSGLKPSGPSHCVLNVLRTLIEDETNIVYIPSGAYKRSGVLTRDPRVIDSPHGRTLRVVGYTSHENRFNFSVKAQKDVKVLSEDGNGPPVDRKIWRTYNIILDGNLHVPELEAVLSEASFNALRDAGVIESEKYVPGKVYTINLRNLKLISTNWANPSTLGLVPLMREEKELEAEQTALNARKKALSSSGFAATDDTDEGDIYRETSAVVESIPFETYIAPSCEYRLMGYKAKSYDCSDMSYADADARVKEVRQRLTIVRYLIRSIVFAMELVGSKSILWDTGKMVTRGESSKLEQSTIKPYVDANLKRVTWDQVVVCS
jgi:hypothetical protein